VLRRPVEVAPQERTFVRPHSTSAFDPERTLQLILLNAKTRRGVEFIYMVHWNALARRLFLFTPVKIAVLLGLSAILLNACVALTSVTRNDTSDALLTLDVPIKTAYIIALVATSDCCFALVSEQPDKYEISLKSRSCMTGALLCPGLILDVFLTDLESSRTKVSLVERQVNWTQVSGCHDIAAEYAARLHEISLQAVAPTPSPE